MPFLNPFLSPLAQLTRVRASCLVAASCLGLSACQNVPVPPAAPVIAAPPAKVVAAPSPMPVAVQPKSDPLTDSDRASRRVLEFQTHLATLKEAALRAEIASLSADVGNTPTQTPELSLDLAMALAQEGEPGDLSRALGLLHTLNLSAEPVVQPWQGLTRFLFSLITQQNTLQEQLNQEVALRLDAQKNLQLTSDKLEALKAIERSLGSRTPTPPTSSAPHTP